MSRIPVNGGGGGGGATNSLGWTLISTDSPTTIASVPNLANGEIVDVAATINVHKQNGGAADSAVFSRRFNGVQNTGGTLADPSGGTSDVDETHTIGTGLVGCTAAIVISGTSLLVQVTRPAGVAVYASCLLDYARGIPPTNGLSAPTLTAPASPFFQPPGGGGSLTLPGTNLTGAAITVGGVAATVTASSPTSITFTCPANAAAGTSYNIQASNGSGSSNTLTGNNGVYYIPASITYCWVASQGFNAGTGAWTDFVGGKTASVYSTTVKPTLTSSWANGQPAVSFDGATQSIQATFTDIPQPVSVIFLGDNTGAGSSAGIAYDNAAPAGPGCLLQYVPSTTTATAYGGSLINKVQSMASAIMSRVIYNGGSSSLDFNEGTATTGGIGSGIMQTGVTFGAARILPPGSWWPGHCYLLAIASSAINSTDSGIIHAIAQHTVGIP